MFFKISRTDLSRHISIAQKAISARSTMQILEGIKLVAKDNKLKLSSTDTQISIQTEVDAVVEREGSCVVDARLFGEIIKKLDEPIIDVEVSDNSMHISAKKSQFDLNVQSDEHFPELPKVSEESFTLTDEEFKDAIRKTIFATSKDETKMAFTGVLFNIKKDGMDFVALDGYRMALKKLKKQMPFEKSAIVPDRSLQELLKIVNSDVKISIGKNQILFETSDTLVYSTLLSGEFFNYEELLKSEGSDMLTTDSKKLLSAVDRAALLAREDGANLIKMEVSDSLITIKSNSELGRVREEVSCKMEKPLTIAFNSRYFSEGLRILDEELIDIHYTDSLNPCVIKISESDDYTYMVLPVRLAN